MCAFYVYIKRKACLLSAKKKIARNHRERSRLFLLLLCACVTPIDATAAGMNLKQFNFYSTRQVNCLLVEKRQPGLGHKHLQKRREKERKREERGGYFVTQVHNKNVPSSTNRRPRRSETKFYQRERENFFILLRRRKGEKEDKRESACPFPFLFREREREERDSFVVVVSLTSFTSSSPGHHP